MNIFFCDIRGTYSGNDKERQEALKAFAENLDSLVEVDNLDNLYFSFISTDHMNDVQACVEELKFFIADKKVKFGPQFSSKHILINGERKRHESTKQGQMMKFLEDNNVVRIYYADDSFMNHKIFEHTMKTLHPEIQIQSFILGTLKVSDVAIGIEEKEIDGLNKILGVYIKARKDYDNSEKSCRTL